MKKTIVRLLSLLLILSLTLGLLPAALADAAPAGQGKEVTVQGISLTAGGRKPLTKPETDYYAEICGLLEKDRSRQRYTVTEGDMTKVYTLSGQGNAAELQEAIYKGKTASADALSSVSSITFSRKAAGQEAANAAADQSARPSSAADLMKMLQSGQGKNAAGGSAPAGTVTFSAKAGDAGTEEPGDRRPKSAKEAMAYLSSLKGKKANGDIVGIEYVKSFMDLYHSDGPVTVTAETLLNLISAGDQMAIDFAESLGFGRTADLQIENLHAMVNEYKESSGFVEPAFVIESVDIQIGKDIAESYESVKAEDGSEQWMQGYRTTVNVDGYAVVSIVYDERGTAQIERRVHSDKPTDFIIALDITASMINDGRATAMLSALEVLLGEILAKPENTVSLVVWGTKAEVIELDIDRDGITEKVFSGEKGDTVESIFNTPLLDSDDSRPDSYATTLGDYKSISSKEMIDRLEILYGDNYATWQDVGVDKAKQLLEAMREQEKDESGPEDSGRPEKKEEWNTGVLLFTDGEASSYNGKSVQIIQDNTVYHERELVYVYKAQVVNVSIGDEEQSKIYREYLKPDSSDYKNRYGYDPLVQDRVIYYNIPTLSDEQLADKITEMFTMAFDQISTEMVQLKSETVTTGVLAAMAARLIETIPAGFEVKKSNKDYAVLNGLDDYGNTMISFELDKLYTGREKTVSYFTVPKEGNRNIDITAYTTSSGTVLYAEPADKILENPRAVEVVFKKAGVPYTFSAKPADDNSVDLGFGILSVDQNGNYTIETRLEANQERIDRWKEEPSESGNYASKYEEQMAYYHDPAKYKESELWLIADRNAKNLQDSMNWLNDNAGGGTVQLPEGEFVFAPQARYERDANYSYVIKCVDHVAVVGAGKGNTVLLPIGKSEIFNEIIGNSKDPEKRKGTKDFLNANSDGLDMFYFNEYADKNYPDHPDYLENADFKGFTVDGKDACCDEEYYNSAGKGFMINLFKDCTWDDVGVINTDGSGFGIDCPMGKSRISDCTAENCGKAANRYRPGGSGFGIGIGYDANEKLIIENCRAVGNNKFGFFIEHQDRFQGSDASTPPSEYNKYIADFPSDRKNFIVRDCTAKDNLYNFGGLMGFNTAYEDCHSVYTEAFQLNRAKILADLMKRNEGKDGILLSAGKNYLTEIMQLPENLDDASKLQLTGIYWGDAAPEDSASKHSSGKTARDARCKNCTFSGTQEYIDEQGVSHIIELTEHDKNCDL